MACHPSPATQLKWAQYDGLTGEEARQLMGKTTVAAAQAALYAAGFRMTAGLFVAPVATAEAAAKRKSLTIATEQVWCAQCDRRVTIANARACRSRWCSVAQDKLIGGQAAHAVPLAAEGSRDHA